MKGEAPGTFIGRAIPPAGSIPAPRTKRRKAKYIRLGMKKPGENDQHKTTGSRKDGTVPAEGQPPEWRDRFRFMGLVMSIIFLHISRRKETTVAAGGVGGGAQPPPHLEEQHGMGV